MDAHRKERLRRLIATRFSGDRKAFQDSTGLTKGRVTQLLDPDEPFGELAAKRLTDKLGLSDRYFEQQDGSVPDHDEFAFVRRADVAFANGVGKVAYHEDDKPPLVFRRDFLRKLGIAEGDAVVVDGIGHSNIPKIPDGAVVLVNKGDRTRLDGGFFAYRSGDELLIKRIEVLRGIGWLATAENPDFKPKTLVYREGKDDFEVIGRAVWTGATL
jgi:phage repressor protein C with HTH and peptisase S24 domain